MKKCFCWFLSCLVLITGFISCQKSLDAPIEEICAVNKVIFKYNGDTTGITKLIYDDQFRIVKEIIFEKNGSDTIFITSVTYNANSITVIEGEAGSIDSKDTITYSLTNGKVTSAVSRNPGSLYSRKHIKTHTYTYNAEGYLSRVESIEEYPDIPQTIVTNTDYKYEGGNVISKSTTSGSEVYLEIYEYLPNKPAFSLGSVGSYQALTQPHVQNLLTKITSSGPLGTENVEYAYIFDTNGQVKSYTSTLNNQYSEISDLEYTCN